MKVTELYGLVRLNVSQFEAGVAKVLSGTQTMRQNFAQTAADVDRSVTRISAVVGGMVAGVSAVTTKMGFGFLQSRDSAEIMLGTILKDGALAKKTLGELFEAAKKTPFSFEGLKDGMVQLANAKVSADKLIPSLYKISDAVAAVGGSDADIKGVTYALSQMMSSGRLNAQDMMQLTNRGIAGWDILAEKMGATVAEVRKLSESGAIDGRLAAEMIIEGMGERFAGAGERLSQKFQGLWSSFMDQARMNAGQIVEPLYNAVGNVLGRINQAVDAGAANGWINRLRDMVSSLARNLEQLALTNGPEILNGIVTGFEQIGQFGGAVLSYLRESGPALMENAQAWFALLEPIFGFLAAHPELVVAFAFFKGGEMLGVNQALMSLGGLFTSLTGGVVSLTGALPALAVALGVVAGVIIYKLDPQIQKLNEELEKAKKLNAELKAERQESHNKTLQDARNWFNTPDKEGAKNFLRAEIEKANREMLGAQMSAQGAKKQFEESRTWGNFVTGDKLRADRFQEAQEAQARYEESKQYLRELQRELARMEAQAGKAPAAVGTPSPGAPSLTIADVMAKKQAEQEEKAAAKEAERDAKAEERRQEQEAARVARESADALRSFSDRMFELQGHIPEQQIVQFETYLDQLVQKYQEGGLSQEQFRNGLDRLNNSMQLATQAADAKANLEDQINKTREQMAVSGMSAGPLAAFDQAAEKMKAQFAQLSQRFQSGEISAFQFRQETEKLSKSMQAAAEAARQEQVAEERRMKIRLLTGQGTQQDYQKLYAMQQVKALENFDQALNQTFNAMFGLGEMTQQVTQGFGQLEQGMNQFGQQMQQVQNGMNNVNPGQAWAQITSMLNSVQGQIANGFNQIQLLKQSLYYIEDPMRAAQVRAQIASLEAQIANLKRYQNPAPIFTGASGEVSGGKVTVSNTFNIQNPYPFDPVGVKLLADALQSEQERRGIRSF